MIEYLFFPMSALIGASIWEIQKNTEYVPNYRKIQKTFEIQKIQINTDG